jgi:hypothetical protein
VTALSPQVEPAAAVELVDLIRQQLRRLIKEHECGATTQPSVAYQLEGALESLLRDLRDRPFPVRRALDGEAVAWVRWFVWVGRRQDMTDAFHRLNPTFGVPVDHRHHCWGDIPERRACRAAARRRELALSLGDRVADLLDPSEVEGGEAA